MKYTHITILILLFISTILSCNNESLIANDSNSEIQNFNSKIENRSSSNDCAEFLNKFIPDTKEKIEFIEGIEEGKEMSKENFESLKTMYAINNAEDFESLLKKYAAMDCNEIELSKLPYYNDCGSELVDCLLVILQQYNEAMFDFYFWNAQAALANFMTNMLNCSNTYLNCVSGN